MNGSYDFSTIATNGEIVYNEREITVTLGLPANSKEGLKTLYSIVLEWLVDVGRSNLVFDDMPGYYFLAEVENSTTLEQVMEFGKLVVTFVTSPLSTSIDYAGDEKWDTFNFDMDYMSIVEFDIVGSGTVSVYNGGRSICPLVNCSSNMTVTNNGYSTNFVVGDNKDWSFKLQNGKNDISITGAGHIKFIFKKERL